MCDHNCFYVGYIKKIVFEIIHFIYDERFCIKKIYILFPVQFLIFNKSYVLTETQQLFAEQYFGNVELTEALETFYDPQL